MKKFNVCLKCHGFVKEELTECPKCHGEVMDWSDWMEKNGNPNHWPKCPVCGSFYLTKNPGGGGPYVHFSFGCQNCGYRF
ncbi:hypothetical protein [Yeguia hominis]|uniref:Uncharacterized protein n=1 Tax=Yeguia hominis TaxID=2763662 RepID=A0A926DB74_9FIRM|nr:hypothetical protein [Yeguia hominis]MBC8535036.1 hypothetical protein [Yeguia hominis]